MSGQGVSDQAPLGMVVGLVAEAEAFTTLPGGDALPIVVTGADVREARDGAQALAARGVKALLSFGLAAGLDPRLGPGAVVVADMVMPQEGPIARPRPPGLRQRFATMVPRSPNAPQPAPEATLPADTIQTAAWLREAIHDAVPGETIEAPILGVDRPIMTLDDKLMLFGRTEAVAADMESLAVARAAVRAGIPFAVLRVIVDPSNRNIPESALAGLLPDGNVSSREVLGALLGRPWEVFDVIALGLDTMRAMRRLRSVACGTLPLFLSL